MSDEEPNPYAAMMGKAAPISKPMFGESSTTVWEPSKNNLNKPSEINLEKSCTRLEKARKGAPFDPNNVEHVAIDHVLAFVCGATSPPHLKVEAYMEGSLAENMMPFQAQVTTVIIIMSSFFL